MEINMHIAFLRMARMMMVLMTFTLVVHSSLQATYEIPDEKHPVCGRESCGKVSYGVLLNQYPGLFLTETQAVKQEEKEAANRKEVLHNEGINDSGLTEGEGDRDMCCTTERYHTINYTMVNLEGVVRSLIHMPGLSPPRYQFVPHGRCVKYGWACTGLCVLEPLYLTLLVYDPASTNDPPITFDTFEVPGYCSCKNTS